MKTFKEIKTPAQKHEYRAVHKRYKRLWCLYGGYLNNEEGD